MPGSSKQRNVISQIKKLHRPREYPGISTLPPTIPAGTLAAGRSRGPGARAARALLRVPRGGSTQGSGPPGCTPHTRRICTSAGSGGEGARRHREGGTRPPPRGFVFAEQAPPPIPTGIPSSGGGGLALKCTQRSPTSDDSCELSGTEASVTLGQGRPRHATCHRLTGDPRIRPPRPREPGSPGGRGASVYRR